MPIDLVLFCRLLDMDGSGNYEVLLHYSFLINLVAEFKTDKSILWDCVELHCLGAFLVVATVDSVFQEWSGVEWFGKSTAGLVPKKIVCRYFGQHCHPTFETVPVDSDMDVFCNL